MKTGNFHFAVFAALLFFLPLLNLSAQTDKAAAEAAEFQRVKKLAEDGDPRFQGELSEIYRRGESGVEADFDLALKWASISAEKKNPLGIYNLAAIYRGGYFDARDFTKADELFREAFEGMKKLADAGNARAQFDLGCMYAFGLGMEKNKAEALKWLRKALENGRAKAAGIIESLSGLDDGSDDDADDEI